MKEIIINNKPVPVHFGLRVINAFTKIQNADFHDSVTGDNIVTSLESLVVITQLGINEGARLSGSATRVSEDEVWDIFESAPELLTQVAEVFMESITPLMDKLGDMGKVSAVVNPQIASRG